MRFGMVGIAVVSSAMLASVAYAQAGDAPCTIGVNSMFGYGISNGSNRHEIKAFTAKIKSTFEQRLPDGNMVQGSMHFIAARDSTGRTRNEMAMQCHRGEDGKPVLEKQISVNDPKEMTMLYWHEGGMYDSTADRKATLSRINVQPVVPRPKPTPEEIAARRKAAEAQQPPRSEFKTEKLGTRNIAGIEAQGSRTTRIIPPGEEGNELQLVLIDEYWRSEELGLTMMAIHDDPRRGRSVQEVEEVNTNEPVAALFHPPEGYKIVEIKPQVEVPVNPGTLTQ